MNADPSKCAVLVPVGHHVEPECEEALDVLQSRGYAVRKVRGYAAIDQARNQMATDALNDGFEELMWVDSDVGFDPNAVEQLRAHELPICCGIYPKKGTRAFAANFPKGTQEVRFGKSGGLIEVDAVGWGFVHTRRVLYETIRDELKLPACNQRYRSLMIPFFLPLIVPDDQGHLYLAEDFAFCHRARQCGFKIVADTRIRLWHVGRYRFGWEDAGSDPKRFGDYRYRIWD